MDTNTPRSSHSYRYLVALLLGIAVITVAVIATRNTSTKAPPTPPPHSERITADTVPIRVHPEQEQVRAGMLNTIVVAVDPPASDNATVYHDITYDTKPGNVNELLGERPSEHGPMKKGDVGFKFDIQTLASAPHSYTVHVYVTRRGIPNSQMECQFDVVAR